VSKLDLPSSGNLFYTFYSGTCQALADFEKNQKAKAEVLGISEDEAESKSGRDWLMEGLEINP